MAAPISNQEAIKNVCPKEGFCINQNKIVPIDVRFDHWYQEVNLIIGSAAFVVPILIISAYYIARYLYSTASHLSSS